MIDILRDEFIGCEVEILKSKNKSLESIKGTITDEGKNSFKIRTINGEKTVLKSNTIFSITGKVVDGNKILKSPQDRIKMKESR